MTHDPSLIKDDPILATPLPVGATSSKLSSALLTGRSLVLLQLGSRLLTFILNQSLIRICPPEVLGTASIQFDLLTSSVEFLSREGIRNALLRSKPTSNATQSRQDAALARTPFRLGLIISSLLCGIYIYSAPKETAGQKYFYVSLGMYLVGSMMELLVEPLAIRALRENPPRMRVRVQAQGGMAIVKATVTVISIVVLGGDRALLGFAMGQLAGQVWLAGRYISEYRPRPGELIWESKKEGENRYDSEAWKLAVANTRQGMMKQLLTESDRIAVSRICPLEDQGGYAVAMNYGSLIARIIFQPLEETLLLYFSSSLNSPSTLPLLILSLRFSTHLFLLILTFLPPLYPTILPLLLPKRYILTSAPKTLETYLLWYIPLLSVNGILESFHSASASPIQVSKQAKWMIGSSFIFIISLFSLTHLSSISSISSSTTSPLLSNNTEAFLIYASCASMLIRITYAFSHAINFPFSPSLSSQSSKRDNEGRDQMKGRTERKTQDEGQTKNISLRDVLPNLSTISAAIASSGLLWFIRGTYLYDQSLWGTIRFIGLSGICGMGMLFVM
ncbi:hypothetical protein TREMEDRAFT_44124 [Tremella mesenterica DSM 1558]|uniref:uncharacterized protein n=1 Tax=Tremella mesenterica (strain ATCC 24925 / CBS 8224 / DSM 1558 / NBRC 9311 / NRRL Y-6157 / RJB 2259-6 / UBC 559-6) TaxID=578456 RepID=UPI0003F493AD|nr:uncharacterized protein TREMEDRAFT_44124 [Tremella mesenterica DSM 1558]EIW69645.1 hypothetical protein TREMEDRAFT_44124 [Tremella mesenterica DSM 1558]